MAKKEHVDMLQQGAAVLNAWRGKHPNEKFNLSGAHLSGIDLGFANLRESDLSGAKLIRANLNGTDLSRSDLSGADFNFANLSGADLSSADLSGTDLNRATLIRAYLSRANLRDTDFRDANLHEADLSKAYLSRANLHGANLSGANLSGADLNRADLSDADLSDADLSRATLSGADLNRADLSRAKAYQTVFNNLDLRPVKGLETIQHRGPSGITTSTLERSEGDIPDLFLKGAGLSNIFITYTRSLVQSPIQYYTCFLSYSSTDELFARRLHNDLQQEGIRCWFAPEDMDIGDKIRHRIDESIRLYDKLLLILSEHSIKSNWVAYEVEKALNKEPEGTTNVLYPVRLDQTILTSTEAWAQEIKKTRHIGNFEHWASPEQYQENFKRLLRALNAKKDRGKN